MLNLSFCIREMSNQLRASELLRQAADLLVSSSSSHSTVAAATATTSRNHSSELRTATRALFAPYQRGSRRRGNPSAGPPVSFWTHRFCLVPKCLQVSLRSKLKCITSVKCNSMFSVYTQKCR